MFNEIGTRLCRRCQQKSGWTTTWWVQPVLKGNYVKITFFNLQLLLFLRGGISIKSFDAQLKRKKISIVSNWWLGISSLVVHSLQDQHPHSRYFCRFPPSFIHQVIFITGLKKLYMTVCSRPEDGLRCRQDVKPPLKFKRFLMTSISSLLLKPVLVKTFKHEVREWWFNAMSATEAIFTARTCWCFKQSKPVQRSCFQVS